MYRHVIYFLVKGLIRIQGAMACTVIGAFVSTQAQCSSSTARLRPGGSAENKDGDYKHSPGRVITTWLATIAQGAMYFLLTLFFFVEEEVEGNVILH